MNEFKELQKKHLELLEHLKADRHSQAFVESVEAYIEAVKRAGKDISSSQERDQLRANLRFWGAFIYEQKKVFPDLTLWPSTKKDSPAKWGNNKTFTLVSGILGGLVLVGLLCIVGYVLYMRTSSQQSERTAQARATQQSAIIQAAMTQTAIAEGPTQMPVRTNTAAPTNTPVIAQTPIIVVDPASATVGAGSTQIAVSTPTDLPTTTALPGTASGGGRFIPEATYSPSGCKDQTREIAIAWRDFTWDKSLSIDASGIKSAAAYLSLLGTGDGETPVEVVPNGDFTVLRLPNPRSDQSYLLQIRHPVFLFEPILIQFTTDCTYDHLSITYSGTSDTISESTWDTRLILVDWGPDSPGGISSWIAMLAIRQDRDGIYLYNKSPIRDRTFLVHGVNCASQPFVISRTSNGKYKEAVLSLYLAGPLCSKQE